MAEKRLLRDCDSLSELLNVLTVCIPCYCSIHWHGILQTGGSAYMDGSAYVSHCPILPHETFVYNFTVPDQVSC